MILIPDTLHVAIDRFVYLEELLELINEQSNRTFYGEFHKVFEDFRKALYFTHCRYA